MLVFRNIRNIFETINFHFEFDENILVNWMRPRQCYSVQIWRFYNDKNVMSENTVYCFQLPKMLVFKKIRNFCETMNFHIEFDKNILVNWMRPRQCYSAQIWRFYNLRQKRYRRKQCIFTFNCLIMRLFKKRRNFC